MTEEELLKFMYFTDNEVIINKIFFDNIMIPCMENVVNKKQLISFLKSEIATKNEILDKKQKYDNNYYIICGERSECHRILDFVNKGGKDE